MNFTGKGSDPNLTMLIDGDEATRLIVGEKIVSDAGVSLFDVPMQSLHTFGAMLFWAVRADDGTDVQIFTGVSTISSVNKAGAYTDSVVTLAGMQATAASSGTLTAVIGITDGTNKITITFTPTGSLTEVAGTYRVCYTLLNLSKRTVNVL